MCLERKKEGKKGIWDGYPSVYLLNGLLDYWPYSYFDSHWRDATTNFPSNPT